MLSKKEVISNYPEYKRLINAVVDRVGLESVEDISSHGISGGYGGFIYYSDTVKFYNYYKKDILALAEDMAGQLGEDLLSMIQSFNCFRGSAITQTDIAKGLFTGKGDYATQVKNAMAWFAAEEVCRMFNN